MLGHALPPSILVKRSIASYSTSCPLPYQPWRPPSSFAYKPSFPPNRTMSSTIYPTPSSKHTIPISQIPTGWSADPEDLKTAYGCFPRADCGIDNNSVVAPILVERGPNALYLVECPEGKGTYYLWNEISDDVWKVMAPTKLEDIVSKLVGPDFKGISVESLEPVGEEVELGDPVTE